VTEVSGSAAESAPRPAVAVERPRVPLFWKLFGLTALLIVIVVGIAVGITIQRADHVAGETVNKSISSAARLFREFEKQRLARLALPTQLLGNDPSFVALIRLDLLGEGEVAEPASPAGSAPPQVNLVSIADQLEQRRRAFGSDLLFLLDDQGRLIARTDQPVTTTPPLDDLYEQSVLVRRIVDDAALDSTTGVLAVGGKLYHAAVAPVGAGTPRVAIAYLINAVAIDEQFANGIAESTNAGVVFVPAAWRDVVTRSANAPAVGMAQMAGTAQILDKGKVIPPSRIAIDKSRYVMIGEPLLSGDQVVGAAVFLRSLDRERAPFREIEKAMLLGGGVALLLAFLFSFAIARRVTRPIEELAGIAQAVTAGDYSVSPGMDRNDEAGILGRAFAKLINSLRDKAELEVLYAQMAGKSEEFAARAPSPARLEEGTVLVTDLRGLPVAIVEGDAAGVLSTLERALRIQEVEVRRQEGVVREVDGHRLVSVFAGERGIIHAIRAARAMSEELAMQMGSGSGMALAVGIATGDFVSGSISLPDDDVSRAVIGNAPLLALLFAWHAPAGHAWVSWETAQAAGGEVLDQSVREEVRLKWLAQPLAVASLPLANVTTGMMRSIGGLTGSMATMRIDSTAPGGTAPGHGSAELPPGHFFAGRYRIEQVLGRGGMGIVYKAMDTQLEETVAIKTLPGDVMMRSREDLERFKREIRLARRITHRNVLRTYDYGEAEGVYFISMELVRGYTLSELLDEAPARQMPSRAIVGIARQICRGLNAAHEQGIIHRDIKPQNVLIDARGEVKLMDFGIARMAESAEAMTQAGLIIGTPHYMSPEQVQGRVLDARSDVYSMGVMIYELLVGRRPFEAGSLTGVLTAHITEKPVPPIELRPDVGREINAIVLRCLEKEPGVRYADAGALLAALDALQLRSAA
jgi:HAMP domain-containing protein/predicted Ser/Thr protein kinase